MKKLFAMFMALLAVLSLASCGKGGNDDHTHSYNEGKCECGETDPNYKAPSTGEQSQVDIKLDAAFNGIAAGKTIYLTTCGQCDVEKIESVIYNVDEDANIYDMATQGTVDGVTNIAKDNLLNAEDVEDGAVVLLVTGTSGKGLGSAGTDVAKETARAKAFADKAAAGRITLIVLHVGGESRRGTQSDPVLNVACPKANLLLVVESGNADNYFTNIAKTNNVPLYLYSKTGKIDSALKAIFGL